MILEVAVLGAGAVFQLDGETDLGVGQGHDRKDWRSDFDDKSEKASAVDDGLTDLESGKVSSSKGKEVTDADKTQGGDLPEVSLLAENAGGGLFFGDSFEGDF